MVVLTGDSLLKRAVQDQETLNVDMIWEVIDWYKQAIVLTREKEVWTEQLAMTLLCLLLPLWLQIPVTPGSTCFTFVSSGGVGSDCAQQVGLRLPQSLESAISSQGQLHEMCSAGVVLAPKNI